ncbi:AraC family transcriptional regulator [Intestinibacillus sp. Marseille-P6563]|uniref:AraC family transcriptional regulator n=1 Tax=Intestinibacillus sp. Marseille-P6563 TaxID=2364792 RepID=UPI000F062832|nr:AraC family transcriptional regulator [Intestinibacillus sp. Marseille-P6563]
MIQCFASSHFESSFERGKPPHLLSASKIDSSYSIHPRILHKHPDFLELLYVRSGSGVYIVDEQRYNISKGDVIICNAGVLHDEDPSQSKDLNTYSLAMSEVAVKGLPANCLIAAEYSPVFPAGECADTISQLMGTIHSLLATDAKGTTETCNYLAAALVSELLLVIRKYCESEGNTVRSRTDIIAGQVKSYIDTHFDEQFTLQDISDAIRVSPYHLAHMFKETTGYSPMQYTVRRRLGEAQSLLITTNMSVTEIAVSVGFGNPCHFNTMFSKYIGMSPSRYRSSYVARDEEGSEHRTSRRIRKQS